MAVNSTAVTRISNTVQSVGVKSQNASETWSAFIFRRRKENWRIFFVGPIRMSNSQWPDCSFSLTRWTTSKISVTYHKNPGRHTTILVSSRPILILPSQQLLYLQNWLFPSGFPSTAFSTIFLLKTAQRTEIHNENNGRIFLHLQPQTHKKSTQRNISSQLLVNASIWFASYTTQTLIRHMPLATQSTARAAVLRWNKWSMLLTRRQAAV